MLTLVLASSTLIALGNPAPVPASQPARVRFVDLTGDGHFDQLVFGAHGSLSVAVHIGERSFVPLVQDLPRIHPTQAVVADLSGDFKVDVLLVSGDACAYLQGDGSGYFIDMTKAMGLADIGALRSCEVVDADSDGISDLLFHGPTADRLYWGQVDGPFTEQAAPTAAPIAATSSSGDRRPAVAFPHGAPPEAPEIVTAEVTQEQARILGHMSMVTLDDGAGNPLPMIRISGVNVQVVSGSGATNGYPGIPFTTQPALTTTNGLGNLIVGYIEKENTGTNPRTGSHNLILGQRHSWTSYGSLLAGFLNTSSGAYSSIIGGRDNTTSATATAICGGSGNNVTGPFAVVVGGDGNNASGERSVVSGGGGNQSVGPASWVGGGEGNMASEYRTAVAGGQFNNADASRSTICGGANNSVTGKAVFSVIVGGEQNTVSERHSSILGGFKNSVAASSSTISGGSENLVLAALASISGGYRNTVAGGGHGWIGGGGFNTVNQSMSSVCGGFNNSALAESATVGGGQDRTATGEDDFVAGILFSDN